MLLSLNSATTARGKTDSANGRIPGKVTQPRRTEGNRCEKRVGCKAAGPAGRRGQRGK